MSAGIVCQSSTSMSLVVTVFAMALQYTLVSGRWTGMVIDGASEPTSQVFAPMLESSADHLGWRLDVGLPHRKGSVAVNFMGRIHVIGGCCDAFGFASSRTVVFDPATNTTSKGASLLHARSHAVVAVSNASIFVCGGRNGATVLDTCERYHGKRWFPLLLTLPDGVSNAQMVAVDDSLYIFGGVNADGAVSGCVLSSNGAATSSWRHISHMPMPLTGHAAIAINETTVMVCGGRSSTTASTAHRYCWFYAVNINAWRNGDQLHLPQGRHGHQIVRYLDRLWCLGGSRDDESNTRKVQVFDEAGGWLDFEDELAVGGESMAIAVVDDHSPRRQVVLHVDRATATAVRRAPPRFRGQQ